MTVSVSLKCDESSRLLTLRGLERITNHVEGLAILGPKGRKLRLRQPHHLFERVHNLSLQPHTFRAYVTPLHMLTYDLEQPGPGASAPR
jgi:hypothetical protein